jgi:pimeloyl-ACP methyl ester carboxylesterase
MRQLISAAILLAAGIPVFSQNYDPPPAKTPDAATLKQIDVGLGELRQAVAAAAKDLPKVHRADLEVYVKAVEWITRHNEWFTADSGKQTLAVIDQGLKRAESARGGKTPWLDPAGRSVARGYRSRIDGSFQPYGVIYPPGYGTDPKKKWRLDIFLHGRDSSLTEVKHLNQHNGKAAPKDQDFVQIDIYGRGNNAYRWAGEEDVFEAMDHFLKAEAAAGRMDTIDPRRVVLKGFSMGGAGTWHIGLRHPDRFAVIQPGAGFTTTHGYIAKLPDPLPEYQEKCLTIYDAYRYAENAFDVPIVAYSGEIDKQRQAAENIEAELKKLGLADRMTHLIGPGLEHKFPPDWQRAAEAELRKYAGDDQGRDEYPKRVRFVTYTLKQDRCEWVQILGLDRHYERALIDSVWDDGDVRVKTANVSRFRLTPPLGTPVPKTITVDDNSVDLAKAVSARCVLRRDTGRWAVDSRGDEAPLRSEKKPGLQGPIDDAFTGPFLCVVGTGTPQNPEVNRAALAQLDRFRREWDKYMRGALPVKKDTEVLDEDKRGCHLVLFGDPGSNTLIRQALPRLPLRWTSDSLELGGAAYDPKDHLPVLVYPSPFGSGRYIVLNTGHTFHAADFQGTNALLYPRLGDYAIAKPTPTAKDPAAFEVVTAGLFDEHWQVPKK